MSAKHEFNARDAGGSPSRLVARCRRVGAPAVVVLLLSAPLAACGGSDGPTEGAPPRFEFVAGEYCLVSRDGVPMRVTVADSSGWRWQLVSSRLTLQRPVSLEGYVAGSSVYTITARVSPAGAQSFTQRTDGLTYEMTAERAFKLGGLSFLKGTGVFEITPRDQAADTAVVITSAADATYGVHTWRYTKILYNGCSPY